jgi:glycosyltransferase involved in cell wall biosynthesis
VSVRDPGPPARLPGLSLVLPVHNEAENLPWILDRAAEVLPAMAERVEVVVVDDGSQDGSGDLARSRSAELGLDLQLVRHEQKSGYGITVADGLRAAKLDWVGFTDADGQFDIADFSLLAAHVGEADLVAGWRIERADASMRSVVSGVYNVLLRTLYHLNVRDVNCAMKLMPRRFLESIELDNRSAVLNAELYLKARAGGWRTMQVGVPHHPRRAGVRSGARPRAILRAIKELVLYRFRFRGAVGR